MPKTWPLLLAGSLIVVIILLMMCAFQVGFTETVVVTRFDKIQRTIKPENPGAHWKWPWPIDRVHRFDARLRALETEFKQLGTRDQRTLVVTAYATWQIEDPEKFLRNVGREDQASRTIQDLLEDRVSTVMRTHDMDELVNLNEERMRFSQIEAEFLEGIKGTASTKYGIRIQSVGIKRLAIPEPVTREVFARMKEDRQKTIKSLTAEGTAEAAKIQATARERANKIVARADAYARKIEAQGDAEAAKYLKFFAENATLSDFLKKRETLLRILKAGKITLVLDASRVIPFDLLRPAVTEPGSPVKPAKAPGGGPGETTDHAAGDSHAAGVEPRTADAGKGD